jgi:UDP-galactose transporter
MGDLNINNNGNGKTGTGSSCLSFLSAKNASLLALVFQQVGLVLMIRHSRTRKLEGDGMPYLASTAVVTAECLKLAINLTLQLVLTKRQTLSSVFAEMISPDALYVAVPAFLYVTQNNLLFVALGNLTVPVYQVTNQGKLLTTAFCSRLMLNKSISWMQYLSLLILALGVAVVQLSSIERKGGSSMSVERRDHNQLLGLVAVFISCATSGFAGVYFEKMLKSTKAISVYMRNCQLALWSIFLGLAPVLLQDFQAIQQHGFFAGYDGVVVGVIICQAMTGLIVALVMKYADTILKGFATSVAVVLATILSIFIWDAQVDGWFVVGAAMVIWAVGLYSKYPAKPNDDGTPAAANNEMSKLSSPKRRIPTWQVLVPVALFFVTMEIWRSGTTTLEMLRQSESLALKEYLPVTDSQIVNSTLQVVGMEKARP